MRCFTPREIEYVEGSETSLAGHFAAKEAVAKAFGTGFRAFGLKDVEILHDNLGRPYLAFDALTRIQKAVNLQGTLRVHLSISHEREYAMATCIIEKTSY